MGTFLLLLTAFRHNLRTEVQLWEFVQLLFNEFFVSSEKENFFWKKLTPKTHFERIHVYKCNQSCTLTVSKTGKTINCLKQKSNFAMVFLEDIWSITSIFNNWITYFKRLWSQHFLDWMRKWKILRIMLLFEKLQLCQHYLQ